MATKNPIALSTDAGDRTARDTCDLLVGRVRQAVGILDMVYRAAADEIVDSTALCAPVEGALAILKDAQRDLEKLEAGLAQS